MTGKDVEMIEMTANRFAVAVVVAAVDDDDELEQLTIECKTGIHFQAPSEGLKANHED